MPTLMSCDTFNRIAKIRSEIISEMPAPTPTSGAVAGIFVPWAGSRLVEDRGIYYIGMATHGHYDADEEQTYESKLLLAKALCEGRIASDYWQFLDGLTWSLFGDGFDKTTERWGWSNLFKIGWSGGSPKDWPSDLRMRQEAACVAALCEELAHVKNSLVFIASHDEFSLLHAALSQLIPGWKADYAENWKKNYADAGIWWFKDTFSGNLYCHGYHPRAAVHRKFWGAALGCTVHLVRSELPAIA